MVRKRKRTGSGRRSSRRSFSSEESESDSDLSLDSGSSSPVTRSYGLRQRKQPMFCQDFDYDEEEELEGGPHKSEDEEYDVSLDIVEAKENHDLKNNRVFPKRNTASSSTFSVAAVEDVVLEDGLIDFEDVIRADVVVNKQKVDYENVLNKSEIRTDESDSLLQLSRIEPVRQTARRGRRPNTYHQTRSPPKQSATSQIKQQDTNDSHEEDTNLEVQIDPLDFVQCDTEPPSSKSNGLKSTSSAANSDCLLQNGSSKSPVDPIEKFVPPELDEKEKEVVLSNEYLLGNHFNMTADEFLEKQAQHVDEVVEEEVPQINFEEYGDSDDDVVIIEKKPEIIVLDDDD